MNETATQVDTSGPVNTQPLRFRWSHRAKLHRVLVKTFNAVVGLCPFTLKYAIGKRLRRDKFPYKLIKPGSTVVQIGAPRDTLVAGRSRGMYFSLFNGCTGKTVIIEPAETSQTAFLARKAKHKLDDLIFLCSGAWNEETELKLFVDPSHPATNFTEGTVDYDADRLAEFEQINIPCNTVDNLLRDASIDHVDMLSMTTNGAEIEILEGMTESLARGIEYICLAGHLHLGDLKKLMLSHGYEEFAFDDRGVTYRRIETPA